MGRGLWVGSSAEAHKWGPSAEARGWGPSAKAREAALRLRGGATASEEARGSDSVPVSLRAAGRSGPMPPVGVARSHGVPWGARTETPLAEGRSSPRAAKT